MKKTLLLGLIAVFGFISVAVQAQTDPDTVTVRELNESGNVADSPDLASFRDSLNASPFAGQEVVFTAVVVSNPRSSGLANTTLDGDDVVDISRIHIFVIDTTANSAGRDGMSIQLVESDDTIWRALSELRRGSVITVNAEYSFFNAESQLGVNSFEEIGTVQADYPELADLLNPREVSLSELNTVDGEGNIVINKANYAKYNQEYVTISNAVVSNVSLGGRPNWALNADGSTIYAYDTSLRVRNDRADYFPGFNNRQGEDGDFVPPAPGAVVNVSGFIGIAGNGDDPDGRTPDDQTVFGIRPFEDGVLWLNGQRFVNGEGGFSWPNDITLLGSPPLFSNVAQSDSSVTPEETVDITATVVGFEGNTVQEVKLFYTALGVTDSVTMTANADVYTGTIPAFPGATPVTFYMTAVDNEDLSVRNPITGNYSYFVEGDISTIAEIQETTDGGAGDSPLAGAGAVSANITATVTMSAVEDALVTIQDRAAAWSGVFLDNGPAVDTLEFGEIINITSFEVQEAFGVTELTNLEFTVMGTNDMVDTLEITGLTTQEARANFERYEGTLLTFADVKVTTNQADGGSDFGEFEIGSRQGGGAADTLVAGQGLRFDDRSPRISGQLNETIKIDAQFTSFTAIMWFSFGNAKLIGGNPDYFVSDDFTLPDPRFLLLSPADMAAAEVTGDIVVEWEETTDFDGNDVTYEWVLYAASDSSEIVAVPSDNDGTSTMVTLPFETVDGLLAGAGLTVGQSADFVWNVRVSDGTDTLAVSGPSGYDVSTNTFAATYFQLNLTRGLITSSENELGLPAEFNLDQNYPNPFNPTTNINFSLPQTSRVTLEVYDMLGRKVSTLINNEQMNAANHTVTFDASSFASGMYIYRIQAGSFTSTRKMMLIK
ncbi:MAG: T9SS type A sorting domain-containing protein [Bacteroidota bacterium]